MAGGREAPMPSGRRPSSLFRHALVAVDGTEAGFDACRRAAALVEPGGAIELVYVVDPRPTVYTGLSSPRVLAELEREGADALDVAVEIVGGRASPLLLRGAPVPTLLRTLDESEAAFVAIGTHGHKRITEMVLGGVGGELLHRAPCAVLVARGSTAPAPFPGPLLVGMDGSSDSERALAVAQYLATRFATSLRVVTAIRDSHVDLTCVRLRTPFAEEIDDPPVEALERLSKDAGLLIVGSRGLRGVRALGSVSERIAHRAACSVLVVRAPVRR